MAGQPQTVKVQHGCGCGSAIAFLLVIGLIGLFIEDVGKHPGTWIPIFVVAAIVAAVAGWWYYSEQQKKPPPPPPGTPPPPPNVIEGTATPRPDASTPAVPVSTAPATKACPDCAETVKAQARVCRFCGYRFEDDEIEEAQTAPPFEPTDDKSKYQCPECGAIFSDMNGYLGHAETHRR